MRRPLSAAQLSQSVGELNAADESVALAAVSRLGESRDRSAVPPLVELLALGTVPVVAGAACQALGLIKDPHAIQILTLYAGNTNIPVRRAAVLALAALADERVTGSLIERLGDSAPDVRAVAAEALAARNEVRAVPRLHLLLAKSDPGAAAPLGKMIPLNEVPGLAELKGEVDDAVLATALGEVLKRPEVPDRLRLDLIETLGSLPGPAVATALVEYLMTVPDKETRLSRDAAQKALEKRGLKP